MPDATRLSTLLTEYRASENPQALEELIPLVYSEMRRLAGHYMKAENSDHTLQPTALVNEAWIRLAGQEGLHWNDRAHFIGIAAGLMKRILIDHARARKADKRGGSQLQLVTLEAIGVGRADPNLDIIEVADSIEKLAALSPRQAQIVELRCFGGLSLEEISAALGISIATVKRDWTLARAWLLRELGHASPQG